MKNEADHSPESLLIDAGPLMEPLAALDALSGKRRALLVQYRSSPELTDAEKLELLAEVEHLSQRWEMAAVGLAYKLGSAIDIVKASASKD